MLSSVDETLASLSPVVNNTCLFGQHEEQLLEFKRELSDVLNSLLQLDLEDDDEVLQSQSVEEKGIFDCSLEVTKFLHSKAHTTVASDAKGVKLPKLDIPTFNGDILGWKTSWEQFRISVHKRSNLSDSPTWKNSCILNMHSGTATPSAPHTIEGLSRSGEPYV